MQHQHQSSTRSEDRTLQQGPGIPLLYVYCVCIWTSILDFGGILHLEFVKVNIELLRGSINGTQLVDCLDALGGKAKSDLSAKVIRVESFPLKIDVLYLLDTSVGEGNNASLTVGGLPQEVADASSHFHGSGSVADGGL